MKNKLLITVLGHRNSGKSKTWYTLFNRRVRTGWKQLRFADGAYVDVFLVNGSPEERGVFVGEILNNSTPSIVLCSMQYTAEVKKSFDYFISNDYRIFVQWLNPGYRDSQPYTDSLRIVDFLKLTEAGVEKEDGNLDPNKRTGKIRDLVYKWAKENDLLKQ
jgi:hypothetical protein